MHFGVSFSSQFVLCCFHAGLTLRRETLTLTQTLTFSFCSVTLERLQFDSWIGGRAATGCKFIRLHSSQDLSRCDITQIGGDRNAHVNLYCVSYISSAAVCSYVDHNAAYSCTHTVLSLSLVRTLYWCRFHSWRLNLTLQCNCWTSNLYVLNKRFSS